MIAVSMLTADARAARSKNVPKLIPYGLLSTMSQQLAVAFHPVFLLLTSFESAGSILTLFILFFSPTRFYKNTQSSAKEVGFIAYQFKL